MTREWLYFQVAETFYIKDEGTLWDEEKRSVWRDIMQEDCDTKLLLGNSNVLCLFSAQSGFCSGFFSGFLVFPGN